MTYSLVLQLQPSRRFTLLLVFIHLVGITALLPLALHFLFKLAGSIALLGSAIFYAGRDTLICFSASVHSLELQNSQECKVSQRNHKVYETKILKNSFISPWFIILNLQKKETNQKQRIIVFFDMVPANAWREVRIWLRWK